MAWYDDDDEYEPVFFTEEELRQGQARPRPHTVPPEYEVLRKEDKLKALSLCHTLKHDTVNDVQSSHYLSLLHQLGMTGESHTKLLEYLEHTGKVQEFLRLRHWPHGVVDSHVSNFELEDYDSVLKSMSDHPKSSMDSQLQKHQHSRKEIPSDSGHSSASSKVSTEACTSFSSDNADSIVDWLQDQTSQIGEDVTGSNLCADSPESPGMSGSQVQKTKSRQSPPEKPLAKRASTGNQ